MLAQALSLHQKGDLSRARTLYLDILANEPDNAEALHLLGALTLQSGDAAGAEALIGRAIALRPNNELYHNNRANALRTLQRNDEALACLDAAIAINPRHAESYYNKGILLAEQRQAHAAVEAFDQALACDPGHAAAHYNKGNALLQLKDHEGAIASFSAAIALRPGYAKAHYNQGTVWRELKQDEKALACFTRAIELNPAYAKAYYNRGNALQALKRHAEAVSDYDRCIELQPRDDLALVNKGNALLSQQEYETAVQAYDQAIVANPQVASYHSNKGNAYLGMHRTDRAIDAYDRALQIDPLEKDAHFNRSICHLLTGDLQRGFSEYEWRWRTDDMAAMAPRFAQPRWTGREDIKGKRILLHCEQGLGDTIQFVRYARRVGELGAHVILVVQAPLLALFKRLGGSGELLADGSPLPPFDYHCPLLSLPAAFATSLDSIPASTRYLSADPVKAQAWRDRLGPATRLRIGLAWSGRAEHKNDENRSLALAQLLAALPADAELISLQKEVRERDRAVLAARGDLRFFGDELRDFSDTAALCEAMDMVVSVDTSVAHMAAALGKPTWILLPYVPDWRWLLDRDDSPWYPTVRLFRQIRAGDWTGALDKLRQALAATAAPARAAAPVRNEQQAFAVERGRVPVLLSWQAGSNFGWGLLGLNLLLNWANDPQLMPLLGHRFDPARMPMLDPFRLHALQSAIEASNRFVKQFLTQPGGLQLSFPMIDGLGNGLTPLNGWRGSRTVGRCIFEDTDLAQLDRKLAKYDCLLTASRWNQQLLAEKSGRPVEMIHEGIDHALFFPGPKTGTLGRDRFYVFSGGKVEFRKGQDLVLRAFAVFAARHPDAVLVTAWQSPFWKNSVGFQGTLDAALQAKPSGDGVDVVRWAADNGIKPAQVLDLGMVPNQMMPQILREMDCAVQVSRAEACTNLPAKEAMACGIPVILAHNTGVLDLIAEGNCLPVRDQRPVAQAAAKCGVDGWGESQVDEIVAALEQLYADSTLRDAIGKAGARWIVDHGRTWHAHARQLKTLILG